MASEELAKTQQHPEPETAGHRGPGRRALELLAGTAVSAAGFLVLAANFYSVVMLFTPAGMQRFENAKWKAAETQLHCFRVALLEYTRDIGQPPTAQQGLAALVERPASPPRPARWRNYLDIPDVPRDPWGNLYHYVSPGPSGSLWFIRSFGKDGMPGGSGQAADLAINHRGTVGPQESGQ